MNIKKLTALHLTTVCFFTVISSSVRGSEWEIANHDHYPITSIQVAAGVYVDSLEIFPRQLGSNQENSLGKAGGSGGKKQHIVFEKDEKLIGISGKRCLCIDSIKFHTNYRTYGPYGGTGGTRNYAYDGLIYGLHGKEGKFLNIFLPSKVLVDIGIKFHEINAQITSFNYDTIPEYIITQHAKPLNLIETRTVINQSNAKIYDTVGYKRDVTSSFIYGFKESLNFSTKTEIHANLPLIANCKTDVNFSTTVEANQQSTKTMTETYTLDRKIEIGPQESIRISAFCQWIENLEIPFTANVTFTVTENNQPIEGKLIKSILEKNQFKGTINNIKYNSIDATVTGNVLSSYGLKSVCNVTQL